MLINHLKKERMHDWCDQYRCLFDVIARQARCIDRRIIREGAGAALLSSIIQRQGYGGCWMGCVLRSLRTWENNN